MKLFILGVMAEGQSIENSWVGIYKKLNRPQFFIRVKSPFTYIGKYTDTKSFTIISNVRVRNVYIFHVHKLKFVKSAFTELP